MKPDKRGFEALYRKYNKRSYIHPDPLEFVYRYKRGGDREIAGLIASSLAYGNVRQILKSVEKVLQPMGLSPGAFLSGSREDKIKKLFGNFRHRFTGGGELAAFLINIKQAVKKRGSLKKCFLAACVPPENDFENALYRFADELNGRSRTPTLIPHTGKKSPFKRLNLYLRWMIRKDAVDPGTWAGLSPAGLIIPLDTHMFRIARELGLTGRNDASMRTALDITGFFRGLSPDDPVKYDFALTRTGILKNWA